ncbi:MAG: hypothetical protein E7326_07815 [Clostridiales bacterium]|nr:hypothetical protein [Clostridiales bacterium]
MKEKIARITGRFERLVLARKLKDWQQVLVFLAIKYLYELASVLILKDLWYQGSGGYMIDFVWWKELIGSAVFAAVAFGFVRWLDGDTFVRRLLHLLFVFHYIPANSAFAVLNTSGQYFVLTTVYFVLILACVWGAEWLLKKYAGRCRALRSACGKPSADAEKIMHFMINAVCILVCCVLIIHKINYNGLSFSLSMAGEDVYTGRADYETFIRAYAGTPYGYLASLVMSLTGYLAPFYLLYSLIRKNWPGIGISVIALLSSFSMMGSKGSIIFVAIVLAIYVLWKMKWLRYLNRVFDMGMLALLLVCIAAFFLLGKSQLYMFILRREMYVPGWLSWLYYDYFSQTDKLYFSQSAFLLQKLINLGEEVPLLTQISEAYFGGTIPSPNTGMFAEAYMQLGVVGIVVYPVLFATAFTLVEKVLDGYGKAINAFLVCKVVLSLLNVPMLRTDFVLSFFAFIGILLLIRFAPCVLQRIRYRKAKGSGTVS